MPGCGAKSPPCSPTANFGSGKGSRLVQGLWVCPSELSCNASICFGLQPPGIPEYLLPVAPCVPEKTHVQGSLSKLGGLPSALHARSARARAF